jgi:hypothetical protein
MLEETLNLPITDQANYEEFMAMRAVRDLLLVNPTMTILDVTPDGMPDWFSDGESLKRQLEHMGLKKTQNALGATEYEDIDNGLVSD